MADLVVIVPSRGRPHAVAEVVAAFSKTCTASTILLFACDRDDPAIGEYNSEIERLAVRSAIDGGIFVTIDVQDGGSMVSALNHAASTCLSVKAIAFMGDDHRPRTEGWDAAYMKALETKPGMVFGNDRIQGMKLPTQIAMSASLVRALGHMAPPVLKHMYVDNYWLQLGLAADCITYLPNVTVEHLHPVAGTAEVDEGYLRVNAREMFDHDEKALAAYWAENAERDIAAARQVLVA
jgi:hypothetical protein